VFSGWNEGVLKSFLIEITADIFKEIDPKTAQPLVEVILDEAQQKGTGKWTSQNALDIGAPIPTINAALESRIISALKSERVSAANILVGSKMKFQGNVSQFINAAENALYASKITSYAQGLGMMKIASGEYGYDLHVEDIAKIWRAGCIIRASLLGDIMTAYQRKPQLVNLMLDKNFQSALSDRQADWRMVVQSAIGMGIPVPAMSASLAYFDSYRSEKLPANLTQAQRDYFGAHTYRRIDQDGVFHTQWKQEKKDR
jgi:6-phosphogluconate dehydrogenase